MTRLTGWKTLGLLAAALLTADPMLADMSVRVKQFSSDALLVVLLVLAAVPLVEGADLQRLLKLAVASFAAALVSYVSLFASIPLLHSKLLPSLRDVFVKRRSLPWRSFAVVGAFDLATVGLYFGRLRTQSRSDVRKYWKDAYLPTDSWAHLFRFFSSHVDGAVETLLVVGIVGGLVGLLARPSRRIEGCFFALFYGGLLAASAARVYPTGDRPWAFTHPLSLTLFAISIGCGLDWAVRRRPRIETSLAAAIVVAAFAMTVFFGRPAEYPDTRGADLVRLIDTEAGASDLVIVHPRARYILGYYTTKPIDPSFRRNGKKFGFAAIGWDLMVSYGRPGRGFTERIASSTKRVFCLVARGDESLLSWDWAPFDDELRDAGFRPSRTISDVHLVLLVYERTTADG